MGVGVEKATDFAWLRAGWVATDMSATPAPSSKLCADAGWLDLVGRVGGVYQEGARQSMLMLKINCRRRGTNWELALAVPVIETANLADVRTEYRWSRDPPRVDEANMRQEPARVGLGSFQ